MKLSIAVFLAGLIGAAIAVIPAVDDLPPERTRKLEAQTKPVEIVESAKANSDIASTVGNSTNTLLSDAQLEDKVSVGMTASEVVRIHGNHYRLFHGANIDSMLFAYDDITVDFHKGRVTHIQVTTAEKVNAFLKNVPYQDKLQLSLPWRSPDKSVFVYTTLCDPAVQTEDTGSGPVRFPALQFDLPEFHGRVR